jgi:hypothetical protein
MKPWELRIGNWIQIHTEPFQVYGVLATGIIEQGKGKMGYTIEYCKPIELTPEWLLKFGFERGDNVVHNDSFYNIAVGGSNLGINPDNGVVWITRDKNVFNNPALIEHVHSLQNLFYALTDQELEIRTP